MKKCILIVTLIITVSFVIIDFTGCKGEKAEDSCQACSKIICGFAGCDVFEERVVCDENEIIQLEDSSSGTTIWQCN
jgi:hypothetical protein